MLGYLEAVSNLFTYKNIQEKQNHNLISMIPIFFHILIEIISRFKTSTTNKTPLIGSHLIEQNLGLLLLKCQERYLLNQLQLLIPSSSHSSSCQNNNENNSSQKLLNSFFEASVAWSLITEITILKSSGSINLVDIDTLRLNVYNLLETVSTRGTIQNISDMVKIQLLPYTFFPCFFFF